MPFSTQTLAAIALALSLALAQGPETITGGLHGTHSVISDYTSNGVDASNSGGYQTTMTGNGMTISSGAISGSSCPPNQLSFTDQTGSYCCPGAVFSEGDNPFCCVGADYQVAQPTFADCFPFCSGSTSGEGISSTTTQACSTSIFLSDSNYSSLAQAAATSLSSNGGSMASNSASATASSSSGSSGGSASSASGQAGSSSSSQAGAAGAMITSGPLAGALMVAGGMIMAL